ncbi:LexA family transcriptional regulator [Salmonella enterica subsp. enterica serovar Montevideo]|uniref:LexA family protein n=1 Tax=Salmonella enterica TaxID=28901 RepID=UPI0012784C13|nr:LexA family transcriptional regulator [Salmonella enterica]EBS1125757.1 LexA family transcriptional regulator [Salmonella enterica subsp. enterica serovar Montevideo]MBA2170764.1 LexA family transcriptional regulator [Salmonella enterica subsp. arizonae serovar 51:z4,z23:-]HCM1862548.1 LexA family transcriptional regulator [Salmonella enterica subsp. houtenae serovar 43:z4,z32:-]EEB1518662.1 helix-turn-helix domain-containing protein [Salmonella enterica subsp. enterica serovar Montevideo]
MSHVNFDDSFPKRVAIARNAIGLTQEQLAHYAGIGRRQVAAYEAGTSRPRKDVLVNLAVALGTTTDWLAMGKGDGPNTGHIKRTVTVREIPLLTHAQAFSGIVDFDDFLDGTSAVDFIPGPPDASEYAFALTVNGESMQSSGTPSFPDGSIIIVDPQITPENGDFGIFIIDGGETTFKQFVIDQGKGYLRSLNPQYPVIPTSCEPEAIGKVIAAQQSFNHKWVDNYSFFNNEMPVFKGKNDESFEERLTAIENKLDMILQQLTYSKKPT